MKPKLLDLFCGAGGATRGYQLAGFHVTGVDIAPQPRYVGEEFVQGDALEYLARHGHEFDAIHASPPCQSYSTLEAVNRGAAYAEKYPKLVLPLRELLQGIGKPYVIENVPGAGLHTSIVLCGVMFGLKVYRHRHFETSWMLFQPAHRKHIEKIANEGKRCGYKNTPGQFVTVSGHQFAMEAGAHAMGIDWMNHRELCESIPPAYTEWIGKQLVNTVALQLAREVE